MAIDSQALSWNEGIDKDWVEEADEGGEGLKTLGLGFPRDEDGAPAWTASRLVAPDDPVIA